MLCGSSWLNADAYTYLNNLGSAAFAWEFLRRNPSYRAAYQSIIDNSDATPELSERTAQRWGLQFAVAPDLRADRAPVVWLPHLNPGTVIVAPAPDEFAEARSISELTPAFSRRGAKRDEHWLLDQGGDTLPVTLIGGADATRPAAIVIPLDSSFSMRMKAAQHFGSVIAGGVPGRAPDALTGKQRRRLQLILRGLDGWLARRSCREIAEDLFGPNSIPAGPEWNSHELRGRTRRLYKRGLDLMQGEYRDLLRNPHQFRF
jgi:hypothetical protein